MTLFSSKFVKMHQKMKKTFHLTFIYRNIHRWDNNYSPRIELLRHSKAPRIRSYRFFEWFRWICTKIRRFWTSEKSTRLWFTKRSQKNCKFFAKCNTTEHFDCDSIPIFHISFIFFIRISDRKSSEYKLRRSNHKKFMRCFARTKADRRLHWRRFAERRGGKTISISIFAFAWQWQIAHVLE